MSPRVVIDLAKRRGLNGIAVTDHDTVAGGLAVLKANRDPNFLVIPGIEVKTDLGDLIGLFTTKEIQNRGFADTINEIHAQGGLVYVPHPIRTFGAQGTKNIHAGHSEIDLWELYNGRYENADFIESLAVFESLGITAPLCGSDAHFPWDIGIFRTILADFPRDPKELLRLSRTARLQATPRSELVLSAGITLGAITKAYKRGQYRKATRFLAGLPWKALKKSLRLSGKQANG